MKKLVGVLLLTAGICTIHKTDAALRRSDSVKSYGSYGFTSPHAPAVCTDDAIKEALVALGLKTEGDLRRVSRDELIAIVREMGNRALHKAYKKCYKRLPFTGGQQNDMELEQNLARQLAILAKVFVYNLFNLDDEKKITPKRFMRIARRVTRWQRKNRMSEGVEVKYLMLDLETMASAHQAKIKREEISRFLATDRDNRDKLSDAVATLEKKKQALKTELNAIYQGISAAVKIVGALGEEVERAQFDDEVSGSDSDTSDDSLTDDDDDDDRATEYEDSDGDEKDDDNES